MTCLTESPKDSEGTFADRHHRDQIEVTVFHRREMLQDPALQAALEDRACRRDDHHQGFRCQRDCPHHSESPLQEKH